jgi:2',3'-cyclic-nucleotide 2'-phosphodiesterase
MSVNVLYIGEIVGKSGVFCVKNVLPKLKKERNIDFVVACGDSATGGAGIGKNHSIYLRKLGIDVITGGECVYYKKDMVEHIQHAPYVLRPANYPQGNPGRGWRVYESGGRKIAVAVFLGQAGFTRVHLSNPFGYLPELAARLSQETPIVLVDFHAATTAEKYTMFRHADGLVSAIIGSHGKVLTADETISGKGTAFICDAGRTGSIMSVGGLDPKLAIQEFLTGIPEWSKESWEGLELQGLLMKISDEGRAESVERLRVPCLEVPDDRDGNGDRIEREDAEN